MKISHVYKKGDKTVNEDAYVINENAHVFAAIDGATGLDGVPGYLASRAVQEKLEWESGQNSLSQCVEQANNALALKTIDYFEKHIKQLATATVEEIPKQQRSTTGIAAVKLHDNAFTYFHAGDCMLFVQYENGDIHPITYDLVQYTDGLAIDEMIKLRAETDHNMDMKTLREHVRPILLENRQKYNTPKGYAIMDGTKAVFDYSAYGQLSLNRISKLLLLTDGLLLPTTRDSSDSWQQTAKLAFDEGLNTLMREVESREEQDPACEKYPRLKQRDDKTGVLLEFEKDS